jgi:hypothetical protein
VIKIKERNSVLEQNVTSQAAYDFSKCKNIKETTLSVVTRLQKCEKDLANRTDDLNSCTSISFSQNLVIDELKENVTSLEVTKSILENEIVRLTTDLEIKSNETELLSQNYAVKLAGLQSTVDTLQEDFSAAGLCYNSTEESNCTYLLDPYFCVPKTLKSNLCSASSHDDRLNLFGLSQCQLVGDDTLGSIDVMKFIHANPKVSATLIVILTLATYGLLTPFLWCYLFSRKTVRMDVRLPDNEAGGDPSTDPAEAGPKDPRVPIGPVRIWSLTKNRGSRAKSGVRLKTFKELYDQISLEPVHVISEGNYFSIVGLMPVNRTSN